MVNWKSLTLPMVMTEYSSYIECVELYFLAKIITDAVKQYSILISFTGQRPTRFSGSLSLSTNQPICQSELGPDFIWIMWDQEFMMCDQASKKRVQVGT